MNNYTDIIRLTVAILSVVKLVLSAFGIDFPEDLINTIVNIVAGLITIYAFIKHNFVGKKGRKQKEHLQKNGLL
ncbi:MAG TPA: phage holin [Bacillales bacterium]|nr:phage holin [Bacillales bacterium]